MIFDALERLLSVRTCLDTLVVLADSLVELVPWYRSVACSVAVAIVEWSRDNSSYSLIALGVLCTELAN